jgi:hypothetical protein
MDNFAFHKESYLFEIERKDKLNGSLSFPVGVVALLAGALSVMAKAVSIPLSTNQKLIVIFLSISGFCLVVACYYLIRTYWGHPYKYVAYPNEFRAYRDKLVQYYVGIGDSDSAAAIKADGELSDYVLDQYASDATFNAATNNAKSAILFKANSFIIAALVCVVLAVPSYLYHQASAPAVIYKVQLTSEAPTMTTPPDQQEPNKPAQSPPPPPTQQTKPEPPPSRLIKEHVEKPDRK